MSELTRQEFLVGWLADNDYRYVYDGWAGGMEYLETLLLEGFKGYRNMTLEELETEYSQRKMDNEERT